MRMVGLDLGSKRIGTALSDPEGVIAAPLRTIRRRGGQADIEAIARLLEECESSIVVLGLPQVLSGAEGLACRRVRRFGESLRLHLGCTVHYCDERFSTTAAERVLIGADLSREKRRKVVDAVAAALILQTFIELGDEKPGEGP